MIRSTTISINRTYKDGLWLLAKQSESMQTADQALEVVLTDFFNKRPDLLDWVKERNDATDAVDAKYRQQPCA